MLEGSEEEFGGSVGTLGSHSVCRGRWAAIAPVCDTDFGCDVSKSCIWQMDGQRDALLCSSVLYLYSIK